MFVCFTCFNILPNAFHLFSIDLLLVSRIYPLLYSTSYFILLFFFPLDAISCVAYTLFIETLFDSIDTSLHILLLCLNFAIYLHT